MANTAKKYKYYLKDASGNSIIVFNGNVTTAVNETDLGEVVANWDEIQFSWVRNEKHHGIFRKQTTAVKFVGDAAKIIRHYYYANGGIMADLKFVVKIKNISDDDYVTQFENKIDFATFKGYQHWVEVNTMEGGITELINAYENVDFEIPVLDSDCTFVNMDGITLKTRYRYVTSNYASTVNTILIDDEDLELGFSRQEGDLSAGNGFTVARSTIQRFFLFEANYDTTITIRPDFRLAYNADAGNAINNSVTLMATVLEDSSMTNIISANDVYIAPFIVPAGSNSVIVNTPLTIPIGVGQVLNLSIKLSSTAGASAITYAIQDGNIYLDCETNSAQSTDINQNKRKGYREWEVAQKIVLAMSNNQNSLLPSFITNGSADPLQYYDAIPFNDVILSEQSLKNYATTPKIKTKLSDIVQDLSARYMCGMGVTNNRIVIERLDYFYDKNTVIGTITDVHDLEIIVEPQAVINSSEWGYDSSDGIDDINKVNEFNVRQVVKHPNSRLIDKERQQWSMLSPYYLSMYYIELVRAQNAQNTLTVNNTKRDDANRNFIVQVGSTVNSGVWDLKRGATITGIDYPSVAYNAMHTPARNRLRNAPLIKSYLYGLPDKVLTYQTSEQNGNITTRFNNTTGTVIENLNVNYGVLPISELFQPVRFKLKGKLPLDIYNLMEATPYGVLKFNWLGNDYEGFVLNINTNLAKPQIYELELRSSPKNDLSKLIY